MKNIQVGDIVRVTDDTDPHRYVVKHTSALKKAESFTTLVSLIDDSYKEVWSYDIELVEGIERVQRGDIVSDRDRDMKVLEVGFNSFMVSCEYPKYQDTVLNWYTFQEAKDWKIVGKDKECKHEYGVSTRIFMASAGDEVIEQFCRECCEVLATSKRVEEEPPDHTIDIMKRMEIRNILERLVHRGRSPFSDVEDLIERTTDELLEALKAYEE